jgi:hypothetical protein
MNCSYPDFMALSIMYDLMQIIDLCVFIWDTLMQIID